MVPIRRNRYRSMAKIKVYVCENYLPDFIRVCEEKGLADVVIDSFPSLCADKGKKAEISKLFAEHSKEKGRTAIICSKQCGVLSLLPPDSSFLVHSTQYCFSHLASESFINYILGKGGYIIGSGWLQNWRQHIADAGFDQDTAIKFYHEFAKELVFFSTGIETTEEKNISALSRFLDLPSVVVPIELDGIGLLLDSVVSQCKLAECRSGHEQAIVDCQIKCAEYAAILDLLGKIASFTNEREAIGKAKEIFMTVFGAKQFTYWSHTLGNGSIPDDIAILSQETGKKYLLFKEQNRFCITIRWKEKIYGIIDVGGFLFPQYIEKYLSFSLEIAKICGLVLLNNSQYEKILKSEQELRYSSFHDSLTGLYNRTYINGILGQQTFPTPFAVFMFDIDRLKFVNDRYGHAEGDELISGVARILKSCLRETDIVARIGGDEFIAILQDTDQIGAGIIQDRIKQKIAMTNESIQEPTRKISFSIGYAVGVKPDDTLEALMKQADGRMYADKQEKYRHYSNVVLI